MALKTTTVTLTAEDGTPVAVRIPTGPLPTPERVKELNAAFAKVANKENWKKAINAVVTVAKAEALATVFEAIEFHTATEATAMFLGFEDGMLKFRVIAPGYYAGPAN